MYDLERRVGVKERPLYIVHVPKHRLVPGAAVGRRAFGNEHVFVTSDDHTGDGRADPGEIFGIAVHDEVRPLLRVLALQRLHQERGADRGVEYHPQSRRMRAPADVGDIEKIAVGIARRFEIDIGVPSRGEPFGVPFLRQLPALLEIFAGISVEGLHRHGQVAGLCVPVVNQLMRATIVVQCH